MRLQFFYGAIHVFKLSVILCFITLTEGNEPKKVEIIHSPIGTDEFSLKDIKGRELCALKGEQFCAKYDAKSMDRNGTCPQNKKSLYCRCDSSKPTFLLREKKCVKDIDVINPRHERNATGCKFRLAFQDGKTTSCKFRATIPTLSANKSEGQRYSLCSAHVLNDLVDCKLDETESLYLNKEGRWRRLGRLEPTKTRVGFKNSNLEHVLRELSSAASGYHGLIISLQATCLLNRRRGSLMRGFRPVKEIKSCVIVKIAGSRMWSMEAREPSTARPIAVSTSFVKQIRTLGYPEEQDHTVPVENSTKALPTALLSSPTKSVAREPISKEVEFRTLKTIDRSNHWLAGIVAVFGTVLILVLVCLLVLLVCRQKGRERKTKRRRQITGNPTYERGPDDSFNFPSEAVTRHVESEISETPSNSHNYQSLVENSRPHWDHGAAVLYESIGSVCERLPTRCFSGLSYQELIRLKNRNSCLNRTYQKIQWASGEASGHSSTSLQRSQSETSLSTMTSEAHVHPRVGRSFQSRGSNNVLDKSDNGLIGMCQSHSLSSLLIKKEGAAISGFSSRSCSPSFCRKKAVKKTSLQGKGQFCLQAFYNQASEEVSNHAEIPLEECSSRELAENSPKNCQDSVDGSSLSDCPEDARTECSSLPKNVTGHEGVHDDVFEDTQTQSPQRATDIPRDHSYKCSSARPCQVNGTKDVGVQDGLAEEWACGIGIELVSDNESETSRESCESPADQSDAVYHVLEGPYCTCIDGS